MVVAGDHCCYIKATLEKDGDKMELNRCGEITQKDYDAIDETIKQAIADYEKIGIKAKIDTLDCKSSYILLSLFSLLLFLL